MKKNYRSFFKKSDEFNGNFGLTIVQAITLVGKVKKGIRKETEIIGGLQCVKKVLEFTNIEPVIWNLNKWFHRHYNNSQFVLLGEKSR